MKYLILAALILVFTGCDKLIYDQPEPGDDVVGHKVYLSVNVRAAQTKSGLRATDDPSVNMDETYYEDNVYDLAMLIFNSDGGGELVDLVHLNDNLGSGLFTRAFQVELTVGKKYDFYFVANMPDMRNDLTKANIPDRNAMDVYLNATDRLLNQYLYHGAIVTPEKIGFPMARVYKNQPVEIVPGEPGGTIYQPKLFKPIQQGAVSEKVVENAEGATPVARDYVELIRVVAKLEVILNGSADDMGVKKISFNNANRHFRLVESNPVDPSGYTSFTTVPTLKKLTGTVKETYIYYMPEAIIDPTTWNVGGSNPVINYFTIETLEGTKYNIPIITRDDMTYSENYLAFATGSGARAFYSIRRNHHYRYEVRNLEKIEIIYQVNPWNKVIRSTYLGYGYNVHIDEEGKVSIHNTVDACPPHQVKLVGKGGTLIDGDSEQIFINYTPGAKSPDYQLSNLPSAGSYLEVWYNDILVKTFTK